MSITMERVDVILASMRMGEIPQGVVTVEEDDEVRRRWARCPGTYSWVDALLTFRDDAGFLERRAIRPNRERALADIKALTEAFQAGGEAAVREWCLYNQSGQEDGGLDDLDAALAETLPAIAYRKGVKPWERVVGVWPDRVAALGQGGGDVLSARETLVDHVSRETNGNNGRGPKPANNNGGKTNDDDTLDRRAMPGV